MAHRVSDESKAHGEAIESSPNCAAWRSFTRETESRPTFANGDYGHDRLTDWLGNIAPDAKAKVRH